jgi:hypothetical protein
VVRRCAGARAPARGDAGRRRSRWLLLAQTLPAEDVGAFAEAVADDWSLLLPRLSRHASK